MIVFATVATVAGLLMLAVVGGLLWAGEQAVRRIGRRFRRQASDIREARL